MFAPALSPFFRRALVLGLLWAGAAQAQLWATPQQTAKQPVLKGFVSEQQGRVLRQGQTTMTLDVVAGRIIGVLIEGQDAASVARALIGAWGGQAQSVPGLQAQLQEKGFQERARRGIFQATDETGIDTLAVRLSGSGKSLRWRMYSSVNILPESTFPSTRNVTGKDGAPHTIHVVSDFQCPACRQFWGHELARWRGQPNLYRLHYHHYPLSYHANAVPAAEASECAAKQGRFWSYADRLFARFGEWSEVPKAQTAPLFRNYATQLGLDRRSFEACLSSAPPKTEVRRQMEVAAKTYLTGTPTIYLNGVKLVERSAEEMKRIQAVTRAKPSAASIIQSRLKTFR